ncbi:MAG: hypothetical protein ABT00_06425 [Bordetella sp. SCN 68-11]|nr:MAG: hypothetical protein ABT00_06425 [Bordetella sp. SCN 68-11]
MSGGQTEMAMSAARSASARVPASSRPALRARSAVAALRPAELQSTRCPVETRQAPRAAPMAPGCRRAMVGLDMMASPGSG